MIKKTPSKSKLYRLEAHFNGLKFRKNTNDISETIKLLKPDILYTEMYIIIKKGKDTLEKKFTLFEGRKLFNNDMHREIFMNDVNLQYGVE